MPHYFRPIMFNILRIRASTAGQLSLIVFRAPGLPCSRALRHFSDISQFDRLFNMKPILTADDIESEFDEDNDFEGKPENDEEFFDMTTEEGDIDPRGQVGKALLKLGKVQYRHVDPIPAWFVTRQAEVTEKRTIAQIRRCLKSWMIAPSRDVLEEYRNKKLGWRQTLKERDAKNEDELMAYGPEETIAYVQYHMKARFVILRRLFNELRTILPGFKPVRVLDFGCGPGTAGAAAVAAWDKDVKKYSGIDISHAMIDAAKIMTKGLGPDFSFWEKTSGVLSRIERTGDRFDLAIAAHTLTELTSDPARQVAVQMLFESLEVGGLLVLVDRGNPIGSHTIRTARKFLLEKYPSCRAAPSSSKESPTGNKRKIASADVLSFLPSPPGVSSSDIVAKVISPCTHDKPCPLGPGLWCSFAQKVVSSMIHKESLEKFSYVVIQKQVVAPLLKDLTSVKIDLWASDNTSSAADLEPTPSPLKVLNRLIDGDKSKAGVKKLVDKLIDEVDWDNYTPRLERAEWGRVLRSPLKRKGHVSIDICAPTGDMVRSTLSKGPVSHIPSLFTAIKRTTWGGLHPMLPGEALKSPLSQKPNAVIKQDYLHRGRPKESLDKQNSSLNRTKSNRQNFKPDNDDDEVDDKIYNDKFESSGRNKRNFDEDDDEDETENRIINHSGAHSSSTHQKLSMKNHKIPNNSKGQTVLPQTEGRNKQRPFGRAFDQTFAALENAASNLKPIAPSLKDTEIRLKTDNSRESSNTQRGRRRPMALTRALERLNSKDTTSKD